MCCVELSQIVDLVLAARQTVGKCVITMQAAWRPPRMSAAVAAGMSRGVMVMEPHHADMLGQRAFPDAAEIAERAGTCVRLFLEGCRPR